MTVQTRQLKIIDVGIDSEIESFISKKCLSDDEMADAEMIWQYLRMGFGDGAYESVLKHIKYNGMKENTDVMVLIVHNELVKGVILQSYFKEIASFVYSNCRVAKKIELSVKHEKKDAVALVQKVHQIAKIAPIIQKKDYIIDETSQFDNFVYGNSNQLAYWSARQVSEMIADNDCHGISSLCLFGPVGMGKTHLMKSIVCYVRSRKADCKIEYVSAEDFKDEYVNAVRQNSLYNFKKRFAELDALLVDDVQFITSSTGSLEKEFSRVLNSFVDNQRWIVMACDRPPAALKIDERTKSRIHSGLKASIEQSDVKLRLMVLNTKLQQMYDSYEIPLHLLEYIAENVIHSIRELESILQSIIRYACMMKTKVVRESIVHEVVKRSDVKLVSDAKIESSLTDDEIIKIVCEFYNIKKSELIGSSRVKKISRARSAAAYIARNHTSMTLKNIGEMLDRKHSTIMYLIKSVLDDQSFLSELNRLKIN